MIRFLFLCLLLNSVLLSSAQTYKRVSYQLSPDYLPEEVAAALRETLPQYLFPWQWQQTTTSPGGTHIRFAQQLYGIPIVGSMAVATVTPSCEIIAIAATGVQAQPPQDTAFAVAASALKMRYMRGLGAWQVDIVREWLSVADTLRACYRLHTQQQGDIASYEILVDATNGREISRSDRGVYFSHKCQHTASDTSGRGKIFMLDPLTTSKSVYGAPLKDNNDQSSVAFEAQQQIVKLKNISFVNGVFRLEGPFVRMRNLSTPNDSPATSTTGDFFFTREQQGFEDVMVYFHVDSFQRYIQTLGFTNLQNNAMRFDAHGFDQNDNSQFVPNGASSYIRFGDGGVDDAEDADVIIHEYCHALSYAAAPETNTGFERKGLDEGLADYFASSYSLAADTFAWANIYTWDGHNEFWAGRTTNDTTKYRNSITNFYTIGSIWASALMRIEKRLGREKTHRLMLQELYANIKGQSLADAALHFLDADKLLFGEANRQVILEEFCATKILSGTVCAGVAVTQPVMRSSLVRVSPNPAQETVAISLENSMILENPSKVVISNLIGQEVLAVLIKYGQSTMSISISHLPNGIYLWLVAGQSGKLIIAR